MSTKTLHLQLQPVLEQLLTLRHAKLKPRDCSKARVLEVRTYHHRYLYRQTPIIVVSVSHLQRIP